MTPLLYQLVFALGEQHYALRLSTVEKVMQAMMTPPPTMSATSGGVIMLQGQNIPVVDLHRRLCLPAQEIQLSDRFIIVRTLHRRVALIVDTVIDVIGIPNQKLEGRKNIYPGVEYLEEIAELGTDLLLIYDLDALLTLDEETITDERWFMNDKPRPDTNTKSGCSLDG